MQFLNISTVQDICKICRVKPRTVERWINGETKMRATDRHLLDLYDQGHIMPQSWQGRARFRGNYIDLGLQENFSHQQLSWYFYSCQKWYELLDKLPEIQARIDALVKVCPPAEVIHLERYRREIEALKRRPFIMPENDYTEPANSGDTKTRKYGC